MGKEGKESSINQCAGMILDMLYYSPEKYNHPVLDGLAYQLQKEVEFIRRNRQYEKLDSSFWELFSYLESFWRAEGYLKEDDKQKSYEKGRLFGIIMGLAWDAEEEEREGEAYAREEAWSLIGHLKDRGIIGRGG